MESVKEIVVWILTPILSCIIGAIASKYKEGKKFNKEIEKRHNDEYEAIRIAAICLLKKVLKDEHDFYIKQKWCSIEDKNDIEVIYNTYHIGLHANGSGTRYYTSIMELPESPDLINGEIQYE